MLRRPIRPLAATALLALVPKCGMCVLAYAGLGAWLGLRGPEICGAAGPPPHAWVGVGIAVGIFGLAVCLRRRGRRRDGSAYKHI